MSLISEALKTAQRERSERVGSSIEQSFIDGFLPYVDPGKPPARAPRSRVMTFGVVALILLLPVAAWRYRNGWSAAMRGRAAPASSVAAVPRLNPTVGVTQKTDSAPSVAASSATSSIAHDSVSKPSPASAALVRAAPSVAHKTVAAAPPVTVASASETGIARSKPPTTAAQIAPPAAAQAAPKVDPPSSAPVPVAANQHAPAKSSGVQVTLEGAPLTAVDALMTQAYAAQVSGDFGTAKSLYERAIAVGPATAALYNNYGALLRQLGDVKRSVEMLRLAVSLDRTFVKAWVNLGASYESINDNAAAVGAYQSALRLDPNDPATKTNLARQYTRIGSYPDAQRLLDEVLKAAPDFALAHYALGQLLEAQQNYQDAIREFTRFLDLGGARTQPGLEESLKAHIASLRVAR